MAFGGPLLICVIKEVYPIVFIENMLLGTVLIWGAYVCLVYILNINDYNGRYMHEYCASN